MIPCLLVQTAAACSDELRLLCGAVQTYVLLQCSVFEGLAAGSCAEKALACCVWHYHSTGQVSSMVLLVGTCITLCHWLLLEFLE